MALKDIFNLIKADRYTADGCEEIKKAQDAIAEDAGAPDGTMSHRKDGDYIKQGGKWIPAPAAKTGAKKPSDKQKLAKGIVSAMEERKANPPAKSEGVKNKAELAKQIVSAMGKKNGESKPEKGSKEDVKQRLGAYVKAMNKKNGEFAGRSKKLGESSEKRAQERLAELNRASSESKPVGEPKLKEGVMNSRKAKAFKPELEEIRKSDPQRFRENLIDVLSSWTDENEGYLKNSSLTNLMNLYKYERNQMYETGDAAPRQLTGDCKVRIKKS